MSNYSVLAKEEVVETVSKSDSGTNSILLKKASLVSIKDNNSQNETSYMSVDAFKQFDDRKEVNKAQNLKMIRKSSGEIDISSSISKSSKAIDNIIGFRPGSFEKYNKSGNSLAFRTKSVNHIDLNRIKINQDSELAILNDIEYSRPPKSDNEDLQQQQNKMSKSKFPSKVAQLSKIPVDVIVEESQEVTDPSDIKLIDEEQSIKFMSLCTKGEWAVVEQLLRTYNKDNPLPSFKDPETYETPLMLACKESRLVIVDRLLEVGANPNEISKDGQTALHFAAKFAKDDIVKLLLSKKANPNHPTNNSKAMPIHLACSRTTCPPGIVTYLLKATKNSRLQQDKEGAIPLMYAIEAGSVVTIKELLEKEADLQTNVKKRFTGDTAIHVACHKKNIEALRLLCEVEAPINIQNSLGQTALHICAEQNDETILKYLYTNKANANILDDMDRSALHMAAEKGNTKIVEFLIDKFKCNVLTRDKDGNTLMHVTSLSGHSETTMSFLRRGVPLHMPNKAGSVCLHAAAQKGHLSVVRALLDKEADVNARTKDLYTPLHIAVKYGNPSIVETLIGYGAEVNVKGGMLDESPLHIAAMMKGGEKCAEMLLKSGANVNETMKKGETALHIAARTGNLEMLKSLLDEGGDPFLVCNNGNSALHIGVRYCHYSIVNELISFVNRTKSRIDNAILINLPNNEGETALHLAAELEKKRAHSDFEDTDIMKILLEYDGDMKIQTKFTEETPLHYSAASGNSDVLLEIVNFMENKIQVVVNKQAKNGWSPLLFASHNGHHNIVNILLKNNARVDMFDEHGMTALHLASEKGHSRVAEVLLSHKAFVNAKSKGGLTPLHLAAQNNFKSLLEMLIGQHHASVDAVTLNKKTPLHLAAQYGKKSVCESLLYNKREPANPNAADTKGQTPLHLAAKNDHADVVKLFLRFKPELLLKANPDMDGMTCAHIAAANGSLSVIKEFMRFNKSIIHEVKNKYTGSTPLHLAAEGGHSKVVKVLLNAGAKPYEENYDGMTCLHLAAKYGHIQLLECLKAKMNLKVISKLTGMMSLHVAAQYGQMDFVREMLVDIPANIKSNISNDKNQSSELLNESGLTPLHLAALSGHENIVRLLLNCVGVDVNSATIKNGAIPLHFAAQNGHLNVSSLLLSKSVSQISKRDSNGRTALHFAASHGHLEMTALFIGQGAEINAPDNMGFTSLHFAAKSGYLNVCKLLVEGGASCEAQTDDFKIPLIFAAHFNHTDVVSYLLRNNHSTLKLMEDPKFLYDLMICSKLNNFKSLEEFVLLSLAPAETAAKLSDEYRNLSEKEKERSKDLLLVGDYCESMCTDLVALAVVDRGADKLLQSIDIHGVQFLDILIEKEQKEVISHPSVQQYLSDVWMGNLNWPIWKFLILFFIFLMCPLFWLVALFPIGKNFFKFPVVKFVLYFISHIYLSLLIIYISIFDLQPYNRTSGMPYWYEWVLLICLSGQLVSELINPIDRYSIAIMKHAILFFGTAAVITQICSVILSILSLPEFFYIRNQFLGVASFLCLVVLLDFLSIHYLFGPWTIIIRDLMGDLFRFLVILFIFMIAFACMLTATVQPTQNVSPIDNIPSIIDMTVICYFTIFGLISPADLPNPSLSPSYGNLLSRGVYGISLLILIIVLINLLIAMMADTYMRIQEECDTEWKYGRAKLIRNMKKTTPIPSPFILLSQTLFYINISYFKMRNMPIPKDNDDNFINKDQLLRRKSQIAPSIQEISDNLKSGPENIEDVVNWPSVVKRFLAIRSAESDTVKHDEFPDEVKDIN